MIFGIVVGVHMDTLGDMKDSFPLPFDKEVEIQEVVDLRKVNQDMREEIKELKTRVEGYEEERATENIALKNLKSKVKEYKILAGYEDVSGAGIIITLESNLDENIAEIVEYKKYLISLINELRMSGAEVISINNHRITSRSEVTLAGRHINVNTTAIAPPYAIRAIGDGIEFERYIKHKTLLFDLMQGDGIISKVEFAEEIIIPSLSKEKPIEFFEIKEETNEL